MVNLAGYVTGHPLYSRIAGCITGHPVDKPSTGAAAGYASGQGSSYPNV